MSTPTARISFSNPDPDFAVRVQFMIPRVLFFAVTMIAVCGMAGPAAAQEEKARQVVDAALDKLGGEAAIRSLSSIYFSGKGFEDSSVNAQPYKPGRPSRNAHEERLAVFLDGRRLAYELKTDRGDGTKRWRRFFFPDNRRVVADFINRAAYSSNIQYPSADRDQDARRIPQALLLEVKARAEKLTHAGTVDYDASPHDVVIVTLPNTKVPISLFIDQRTHLLSKYEFTADFPGLGPARFEYTFGGYRPHDKLRFVPGLQEIRINGSPFRSVVIDSFEADSAEAEKMLTLPPELEGFITPSGTVKQVAAGVYFLYNISGFQPMFIEFDTFLVAIEAPANVPVLEDTPLESIGNVNAAADEFVAKIRQTVPNKPIKYVVVTHSHADHYGGLRSFIKDKPVILTTPGNKELYERFVPELKVEVLDRKRTISEGAMSVDLMNVGPNPHTDENIVVYLPRSNYLFQGDLFYFNGDASFPPKDRMTVMPFFARWLKQNNLSPSRIYGFHSTLFATMEHVERVLELAKEK